MHRSIVAALAALSVLAASDLQAQSLQGSPHSLTVQNRQAHEHDFTYLRSGSQIRRFVKEGLLVRLPGNADYRLHSVSYPYARPEVKLFVERLAREYRAACGEELVVTSLVRPQSMHLWNSSRRTVHPTGMAMDLRRSDKASCRSWMESTLLSLEARHVLEATREHRPPHYHVALFPEPYSDYVASIDTDRNARTAVAMSEGTRGDEDDTDAAGAAKGLSDEEAATMSGEDAAPAEAGLVPHEVLRGETLWDIARSFGTSVAALMDSNALSSPRILPGQVLRVPATSVASRRSADDSAPSLVSYHVDTGDSLWTIARQHGTTVQAIKQANNLRSSKIKAGQVLRLPATGR